MIRGGFGRKKIVKRGEWGAVARREHRENKSEKKFLRQGPENTEKSSKGEKK